MKKTTIKLTALSYFVISFSSILLASEISFANSKTKNNLETDTLEFADVRKSKSQNLKNYLSSLNQGDIGFCYAVAASNLGLRSIKALLLIAPAPPAPNSRVSRIIL